MSTTPSTKPVSHKVAPTLFRGYYTVTDAHASADTAGEVLVTRAIGLNILVTSEPAHKPAPIPELDVCDRESIKVEDPDQNRWPLALLADGGLQGAVSVPLERYGAATELEVWRSKAKGERREKGGV